MVVMYSTDMSAPAKAHAVGVLTGILTLRESQPIIGPSMPQLQGIPDRRSRVVQTHLGHN